MAEYECIYISINIMKVCQVVPYFPYREHINGQSIESGYNVGGVERHVYSISSELIKRGHNVTVISTKSPCHETLSEIEGIEIIRIPIRLRIYNSHMPLDIAKYFDPSKYDLIHAHTPVPVMADLAALKNLSGKKPFVLTYHNDIAKTGSVGKVVSFIYNNTAGRFLLGFSNIIISTTRTYAANSKQLCKYTQKVKIVPNGVDIEAFNPGVDGKNIRKKYKLNETDKIVLFVGRLDYYKGCDYLVRAFSPVINEINNAHLIFVGRGPLEDNLQKIAAELKITENISFAAYVKDEDLPSYYASTDVFVLPSISPYEGFGIVQLEAMACGKPIVTTTLPGVSEIDSDGAATLHVPPKDEQQLAEAIITLLKDEEMAKRMGKRGRDLVIRKYSWTKVVESLESIYQDLCPKCL